MKALSKMEQSSKPKEEFGGKNQEDGDEGESPMLALNKFGRDETHEVCGSSVCGCYICEMYYTRI